MAAQKRISYESGTYQDPVDIGILSSPVGGSNKPVGSIPTGSSGSEAAVHTWLNFLQMERYAQDFIDNGYDDLETVKRIGLEDLDAIGVDSVSHKAFILDAVRVLRERGAVWVYLLDEEKDRRDSGLLASSSTNGAVIPEGDYDSCGERLSAGDGNSSGIASGNSSSIPWQDADGSSSDKSGSGSGGRNRNKLVNGHRPNHRGRTTVELTPEHHRQTVNKSLGTFSPRVARGAVTSNSANAPTVGEDLIQRVSDVNVGPSESKSVQRKSPTTTSSSSPLNSSVPASRSAGGANGGIGGDSLGILLRERLSNERIQLSAPPFTSKVSTHLLADLVAFTLSLCNSTTAAFYYLSTGRPKSVESSSKSLPSSFGRKPFTSTLFALAHLPFPLQGYTVVELKSRNFQSRSVSFSWLSHGEQKLPNH